MVYHTPTEQLLDVLRPASVSSQIAGMLSSGDLRIIVGALQLSELLLQKIPSEFGVHFRREGVLHQVQKLTDPDNPICVTQTYESPLCGWTGQSAAAAHHQLSLSAGAVAGAAASTSSGSGATGGRSWTVAGSSLSHMFPDQLRVHKRREESASSTDTPTSSLMHYPQQSAPAAQQPLRLSDMLKRKRVSKRSSNRKGRHSEGSLPHDLAGGPSTSAATSGSSPPNSSAGAYDLSIYSASPPGGSSPSEGGGVPATPSRRSRLADRTSSLLSQLHPSR
jgi:E3 ubiquitin-protein ligase TRIP12